MNFAHFSRNLNHNRATLERRLRLCEEVIKYLLKVDPGQTKKMGVFMLEYNKPKVGYQYAIMDGVILILLGSFSSYQK